MSEVQAKTNISLIGMPGAGKSVIGALLASRLSWDLIDTDRRIEVHEGAPLQTLLDEKGYLALRQMEETHILSLSPLQAVISTGGSAVYSENAMAHLKECSTVIFLDIDFNTVEKRITNFGERGIASASDQTLEMIFEERYPLYRDYADIVLPNASRSAEDAVNELVGRLGL